MRKVELQGNADSLADEVNFLRVIFEAVSTPVSSFLQQSLLKNTSVCKVEATSHDHTLDEHTVTNKRLEKLRFKLEVR